MTAQAWVTTALASKIQGDSVTITPEYVVTVDDFCLFFGTAIDAELAKPEAERNFYTALSGTHSFVYEGTPYTMTAVEMGYQPTFDAWHAEIPPLI